MAKIGPCCIVTVVLLLVSILLVVVAIGTRGWITGTVYRPRATYFEAGLFKVSIAGKIEDVGTIFPDSKGVFVTSAALESVGLFFLFLDAAAVVVLILQRMKNALLVLVHLLATLLAGILALAGTIYLPRHLTSAVYGMDMSYSFFLPILSSFLTLCTVVSMIMALRRNELEFVLAENVSKATSISIILNDDTTRLNP